MDYLNIALIVLVVVAVWAVVEVALTVRSARKNIDEVSSSAGEYGVFTLAKPVQKSAIYSAAKLLGSMCTRLERMEEKNRSLQEKMSDIRAVNRAKWLLIENLNMSEKDAHYYIEKRAMDTRVPRREVAEGIIRTYDS